MSIGQDVRYAIRQLRKNPGFTAVAVLTLALGIGANTAIFTVVRSVLLSSMPVTNPQELVFLTHPDEQGMEIGFGDGDRDFLTYPEFQELSLHNQVFSGLLAVSSELHQFPVSTGFSAEGSEEARTKVSLVSGSYFSVLGVNPTLGRAFTPDVDKVREANAVAVISYRYWQEQFAGDRAVLGRKFRIHTTVFDIIGVAPPSFRGETVGVSPDIWIPLSMQAAVFPGRDFLSQESKPFHKTEWLQVIGRLKPGVGLAEAKASVNAEFHQMMFAQTAGMSADEKRSFLNQHLSVTEGSRGASTLRTTFGKPLQILMAVVGFILLIACANVANLLLARSTARQKEIAVRVAMGAGAGRLIRGALTESVLLAFFGGAVGLLLAYWADVVLLRMVSQGTSPVPLDIHPDARVLAFTLGVSVLTGILFGLVPALRAGRVDLSSVLKGTARTVAGDARGDRMPIGKTLVVAQVALSIVLLVVAGLFIRSFQNLTAVQLGYDRDHLLLFDVSPLSYGYSHAQVAQLYSDLIAKVDAIPGVRGASYCDNGLLGGMDSNSSITIDGEKPPAGAEPESRWDMVGPSFFSVSGIPILYGREIGQDDSGAKQRVAVVSSAFAHRFLGDANPIGRHGHVRTTFGEQDFLIVGIAADTKQRSPREEVHPRFYLPFLNPVGQADSAQVIVRTSGDPASVVPAIRAAVKNAAPALPQLEIQTMKERLTESLASDSMITEMAGAFGVLAVVLVSIGLYGVMAYAVSRRTNEIGVRMALGAQRVNVLWLILRESLLLIFIGAAIGLPIVFGAGKWIASLLFGVKPADIVSLALATVLMFAVGIVACYIPASRAMRIDPTAALRYE